RNRFPTPEELRCMSYLALNHGAKGLLFYAWGDAYPTESGVWESGFKFNSELMEYFPKLLKELKEIGIEYVLGDVERIPATSVYPGFLDVVLIKYKGKKRIIAINPTSKEVEGRLELPKGEVKHLFKPFEVFTLQL
ncbi:MAG: hypothetical protein ACPL7E_09360, partial [bacterium]